MHLRPLLGTAATATSSCRRRIRPLRGGLARGHPYKGRRHQLTVRAAYKARPRLWQGGCATRSRFATLPAYLASLCTPIFGRGRNHSAHSAARSAHSLVAEGTTTQAFRALGKIT